MSKFDQDEKNIHDALSKINVDTSGISKKVINRLNEKTHFYKPHHGRLSLGVALIISAVLIITVATFASGKFDWFMKIINPSFGDIVEQVGVSSEDQGIRMEVIGAQKYNNMAVIYLSLQDITGQNRLTERTEFRDGFSVKMNAPVQESNSETQFVSGMSSSQKILRFDKESNTIYFQFIVEASSSSPLSDPLTLGSFLIYFDQRNYEYEPIPISLSELTEVEGNIIEEDYIFGGSNLGDDWSKYTSILTQGNYAPMPHGEEDQWISNVGIIDGKLHVQIGQLFNKEFGSSDATLMLMDSKGEVTSYDYELTFITYKDNRLMNIQKDDFKDAVYKYNEAVFTVDKNKLDDYNLCFLGSVYSGVEGRWKVATNLNDTSNQMRTFVNDIPVDGNLFQHISINPLGVQIDGTFETDELMVSEISLALETSNGIIELEGGGSGSHNSEKHVFNLYWNTKTPLDVETVTAIIINGTRIELKK